MKKVLTFGNEEEKCSGRGVIVKAALDENGIVDSFEIMDME